MNFNSTPHDKLVPREADFRCSAFPVAGLEAISHLAVCISIPLGGTVVDGGWKFAKLVFGGTPFFQPFSVWVLFVARKASLPKCICNWNVVPNPTAYNVVRCGFVIMHWGSWCVRFLCYHQQPFIMQNHFFVVVPNNEVSSVAWFAGNIEHIVKLILCQNRNMGRDTGIGG